MFSKDQINECLALAEKEGAANYEKEDYFSHNLKRKLVEAKVLTDRWGQVATDIIVHPAHKEVFREKFKKEFSYSIDRDNLNFLRENLKKIISLTKSIEEQTVIENTVNDHLQNSTFGQTDSIWGATIHYSDDIDVNKGLIIAADPRKDGSSVQFANPENPDRCVAVFPM